MARKAKEVSVASVPFDQLEGWIWMNGEFVKWADAKFHVLTHGLHYASAVFEGERAYGGEIFKLTEHTERLHESGRILGFKVPYSVAEIDDACREAAAKQGFSGRLCPSDRLARLGADGRFGAEQPHQCAPSPSGSGRAISTRRRS
jgi:branched-subunit amino acid aminotransferase/4-amino-4-deoxychorismate lyase